MKDIIEDLILCSRTVYINDQKATIGERDKLIVEINDGLKIKLRFDYENGKVNNLYVKRKGITNSELDNEIEKIMEETNEKSKVAC